MKTDRNAFLFLMVIAYASLVLPLLPAARSPSPPAPDAAAPAQLTYLSTPAAISAPPSRPTRS